MIPRYLQKRPSKVKSFNQTSMTIPGLAVDIPTAMALARRGEMCRGHSSGDYDNISDIRDISPFQRGFEVTDMDPSFVQDCARQHKAAERKNVAPSHIRPTAPPEAEPEQPAND